MRDSALEESLRWLRQAEEDVRWTRHPAGQGAYHPACFVAQQVAATAPKSFLYSRGEGIVLGRSDQRWCDRAGFHDPEVEVRGQS